MDDSKKIITSPDKDYTRSFKLMMVDFEWNDITIASESIKKIPIATTLFLYGSKDNDPAWCLEQAKNSNSVLLNMRHRGECELIKGFLLGESNVYTLGSHKLDKLFHRNIIDISVWIAIQYDYYSKTMR